MWEAIQYVGSGLTLVAFIVAALVQAYRSRLKTVEKTLSTATDKDRLAALEIASRYVRVDTRGLTAAQKLTLFREQLRIQEQRQWQIMISVLVIAFLLAVITLVAILFPDQPAPAPLPTPQPGPSITEVIVCNVDVDNVDKCPAHDVVRHIGHSAGDPDYPPLAAELCPLRGLRPASPPGYMKADKGGGEWGVNQIAIRCTQ